MSTSRAEREAAQDRQRSFVHLLPFPFGQRSWWVDGTTHVPEIYQEEPGLWREAVIQEFDTHGFDRQVFIVAALGFLTDSYALFATNIILPSLAYLYWPDATSNLREFLINTVTLAGSLIGQLLFGYLADRLGRRKIYGLELVVVIFGTLGMAQASTGLGNMSILGWIVFYRFVLGVGIGAEYPLSAVITAEFAGRKARAKMMAAVFLMQPLGQILGAAVGWGVLASFRRSRGLDMSPGTALTEEQRVEIHATIDSIWRCVIGVGAFPALLATLWRFSIPESPRYTMDVDCHLQRALADVQRHYGKDLEAPSVHHEPEIFPAESGSDAGRVAQGGPNPSLRAYLNQGNWKYLIATMIGWFCLDLAFYGLGISSPRQLGNIWANAPPASTIVPDWENPFDSNTTIYWQLYDSAKEYVYTICFGSLAGSILLLFIIDYIPRKNFLVLSYLVLSVLLAITGALFATLKSIDPSHWATVVFYAFCQFFFNLGPNTLIFIIPAEIFPTQFRCRCHGISAAAGKLGAILVQTILYFNPSHVGIVIGVLSIPMLLGALITWVWIPELQTGPDPNYVARTCRMPKSPGKDLDILAKGIVYATNRDTSVDPNTRIPRGEAQHLGFRDKMGDMYDHVRNNLFKHGFSKRRYRKQQDEAVELRDTALLPSPVHADRLHREAVP